ncbi:hypothetical protein GDO78_014205 [Eleutherodactylus coqui]|uniref:bis(5'-adenosyl)-triphosphatase n=1 Tax=Eleutherodactylus coqui TaxID=57060 RepID=A0A8J6C403_ELECQ|nr:hypothetical protein GDO78_014205 [Eleutherodactylus coqui]
MAMCTLAFVLTLAHGIIVCAGEPSGNTTSPRLILVSFDGFRADYLSSYSLPKLQEFIEDGVLVREVKNVFITKTFPNHYSIVTGLYAESHGMVANTMYDKENNRIFRPDNFTAKTDPVWWNEATPIWVTNQCAGRRSGSAMWPGTDVKIQNVTLTNFLPYDASVSWEARVNNITSWFTRAEDPINFATMYFHEPDHTGHVYGPEDKGNMSRMLGIIDKNIEYLVSKLKESKLWDTVNVIITSDHGMAQCSQDRVIALDNCIGRENYQLVDSTPVAAILPLKGGDHGYDNALHSMHPFLAAHGPAFHKNFKMGTINSVDIYPMMCHILGLKAEPNNGTLSNTKCLLVDQWCVHLPEAIGIVVGGILALTTITCVILMLKKKVPSPRQFTRLQFQDDDDPLIG